MAAYLAFNGSAQSPIDIVGRDAVHHTDNRLAVHFERFVPYAVDTGRTVRFDAAGGSSLGFVVFEDKAYGRGLTMLPTVHIIVD